MITRPRDLSRSRISAPRNLHRSKSFEHIPVTPTKVSKSSRSCHSEELIEKMPAARDGQAFRVSTAKHGLLHAPPVPTHRQRLSVADLRNSFEQNVGTEASSNTPKTPPTKTLKNIASTQDFERRIVVPTGPSPSSRYSRCLPPQRPNQQAKAIPVTPPSSRGRADHGVNATRDSTERLLTCKTPNSPEKTDLRNSSTCRPPPSAPSGIRRVESVLVKLGEPLSRPRNSKALPKSKSGDSFFTRLGSSHPNSMPAEDSTPPGEGPAAVNMSKIPGTSRPEVPPRRMGKVADLRKLFDRPSHKSASPMPSLMFCRNRHRRTSEAKSPDTSQLDGQTGLPPSSSATTCAPSLTTEIPTNDFSRGFSGQFVDPSAFTPRSAKSRDPAVPGSPKKPNTPAEPDSPVKNRIRQFENLQQNASAQKSNASPHATFQQDENLSGKGKAPGGGWRPMRHRGMQMWRRISQTVSHPTDSKNNRSDVTSGSEDRNSSTSNIQIRLTSATPAPVHSRRSNIFGHRFSRTFYPQRHSEALSGSSSSINSEADNTLTTSLDSDMLNGSSDESHRPNNRHQTPSCHDFLALEHFPSGGDAFKDFSVNFGLDGNTESKPYRHTLNPRGEAVGAGPSNHQQTLSSNLRNLSPHPATPQEEPSALEKVRTQQSSSKEMRRRSRYEAKRAQREHATDKKEFRRDQRRWERDEHAGHSTFDTSPPYLHLPLRFPSIRNKGKDKGKQRATDGLFEDQHTHASDGEQFYDTPATVSIIRDTEEDERKRRDRERREKRLSKKKDRSWSKKTESGFVVRHANVEKIREPKPRRPDQVKKLVNLYREKSNSYRMLSRLGKGSGPRDNNGPSGGRS